MKHILFLMASALLFSACEKDEVIDRTETGGGTSPSGETFVVDYTVSDGATRAGEGDPTVKDERVKSLTYLLYQGNDGNAELLHKREIPLKEGQSHFTFPMTRENMSWEQREALKDTLLQGTTYYAVFVANAKENETLLLNKEDGSEGVVSRPLSEVCLKLPETAITKDDEMFYLFTKSILSTDEGADRETPYNCPVLLQRVVSKTEFRRKVYSEEEQGKLKAERFEDLFTQLTAEQGEENWITKAVHNALVDFTTKWGPIKAIPVLLIEAEVWQDKIEAGNFDYSIISGVTVENELTKDIVHRETLSDYEKNQFVPSVFTSWSGKAEVCYESQTKASLFYIMDGGRFVVDNSKDRAAKVMIGTAAQISSFSIIGFGQNMPDDGLNQISAIQFYGEDDEPSFLLPVHIDGKPVQTGDGKNHYSCLNYYPFELLKSVNKKTRELKFVINLQNIMASTATMTEGFKSAINTEVIQKSNGLYGESFDKFTLTLHIPDLSDSEEVQVLDRWAINETSLFSSLQKP